MLIHDLYPVRLEDAGRRRRWTASGPTWSRTAATSSCVALDDGVARIRLAGSCDGCPASSATLELAIKQALDEHAPDLEALEVEGGPATPGSTRSRAGSSCRSSRSATGDGRGRPSDGARRPRAGAGLPSWFELDGVAASSDGELTERRGRRHPRSWSPTSTAPCSPIATRCADCSASRSAGAALIEGVLACTSCGRRYYLPRAGRSLDDEKLQLEPVPLLRENGAVRVALAT